MPRKYSPVITSWPASFWNRVAVRSGCWVWTRATVKGYGVLWFNGKLTYAHRIAYLLYHGAIPDDLDVLHTCDNPPCCRPDHLFVGTHTDNMRDMVAKGRHVSPFARSRITSF